VPASMQVVAFRVNRM